MKFLPKNVLNDEVFGISLTQSSIRAVKLNSKKELVKTAEYSLEPGTFNQDGINQDKLRNVLETILKDFEKKSLYAAVSVPDYYSFSRSHNMGKIPIHEIGEALSWQVEQVLPLPKDSVYYDWKVIDQNEEGTEIALVAMPKDFLDELIEVFESVQCNPLTFEPSTSNMTRVIEDENNPHIIAEINAQGSSVTFIQNGISHVTITNQFSSNTQEEVTAALQKTVYSIQSLIYHCSQKDPQLNEKLVIKITGESASEDIKNWLQTSLKREVSLLEVPNIAPHLHQAYVSAIGLTNDEDKNKIINLLPDTLRELYSVSKIYQKTTSGFQIAGLFQIISFGVSVVALVLALNAVRASNVELQQVENSTSGFSYNAQEIVKINQRSQSIVQLFPQKNSKVRIIDDLFSVNSENITINFFKYDRRLNQLEVAGEALERKDFNSYVKALEDLETFSKVRVPLDALEKSEDINFSITIDVAI